MKLSYGVEFIDDGRELYAVSSEFGTTKLKANPWLVEYVWSSLPPTRRQEGTQCADCRPSGPGHLDLDHREVQRGSTRMRARTVGPAPASQMSPLLFVHTTDRSAE